MIKNIHKTLQPSTMTDDDV